MGYSNLSILLSEINILDEFRTNKLDTRINILKKFEKLSLIKLSKKTFFVSFGLFKIIAMDIKIIIEEILNTKLKLFLIKTPIIKTLKIDNIKKTSGNNIFKLLIILVS